MSERVSHDTALQALARGDPAALLLFEAGCWRATPAMRGCGWARRRRWNWRVTGAARGFVAQQVADQAPGFHRRADLSGGAAAGCRRGGFHRPFTDRPLRARRKTPTFPPRISRRSPPPIFQPVLRRSLPKPRTRFAHEQHFALLEAIHAGAAGEWDRAEAIFAGLADDRPQRLLARGAPPPARRRSAGGGQPARAGTGPAIRQNIAAWALRGIAWRLAGGSARRMVARTGRIGAAPAPRCAHRADRRGRPRCCAACIRSRRYRLGQSLRGGTQTRGYPVPAQRTGAGRTPCRDPRIAGDLPRPAAACRRCPSAAAPP